MHLPKNEVHIFTAPLTADSGQEQVLLSLLNEDEKQRAARLIFPVHRQRFIIAHGILRKLLALYLDQPPASIEFTYNDYQKPAIIHQDLQFNLSHSDELAVYAITRNGDVGIDIEKIRDDQKLDVAERFFSSSEIHALKSLPPDKQISAFYRLWSRKEAVIKADGKGLSQPLSSFSVAVEDIHESLQLEDKKWSIYPLNIHPDYAAAIATAHPVSCLVVWDIIEVLNQSPVMRYTVVF